MSHYIIVTREYNDDDDDDEDKKFNLWCALQMCCIRKRKKNIERTKVKTSSSSRVNCDDESAIC